MSLSGTLLAPGLSIHRKETRSDGKTEARKGTGPSWDHTSNPTQFRYTQMDWIDGPKSSVPASVLLWATCLHHELVCFSICKRASSSDGEGRGREEQGPSLQSGLGLGLRRGSHCKGLRLLRQRWASNKSEDQTAFIPRMENSLTIRNPDCFCFFLRFTYFFI